MSTRFLNWAMKRGGVIFELWRVWAVTKSLTRLTWRVPYALLHKRGMKSLSRADDVWFIDGLWYLEWLRDGISFRGPRVAFITYQIKEDLHSASWVTRSAIRHIKEDLKEFITCAASEEERPLAGKHQG